MWRTQKSSYHKNKATALTSNNFPRIQYYYAKLTGYFPCDENYLLAICSFLLDNFVRIWQTKKFSYHENEATALTSNNFPRIQYYYAKLTGYFLCDDNYLLAMCSLLHEHYVINYSVLVFNMESFNSLALK